MRRKLIALLVAVSISVSPLCVYADEKDDRIVELEAQVKALQEEVKALKEQLSKYESSESGDIEKYLLDKGLLLGDRIEMAAEMVGAISGFKYDTAEIYEYDTESEQYKSLASGASIGIDGFEGVTISAAVVNGKYVLIGDNLSEELITAFKEFK